MRSIVWKVWEHIVNYDCRESLEDEHNYELFTARGHFRKIRLPDIFLQFRFYIQLPFLRSTCTSTQTAKSTYQHPQVPPCTKKYFICVESRHILAGFSNDWANIKFKSNKCQIAQCRYHEENSRPFHKQKLETIHVFPDISVSNVVNSFVFFLPFVKTEPWEMFILHMGKYAKGRSGVLRIHNLSLC